VGDDERRKIATYVLDNSGDHASLRRQVNEVWADLQRRHREAAAGE
jgi:dephospho-CoA kinase